MLVVFVSATLSATPAAQPLPVPPTPAVPDGFRGIEPQPQTTLTPAATYGVPDGFRAIEPVVTDAPFTRDENTPTATLPPCQIVNIDLSPGSVASWHTSGSNWDFDFYKYDFNISTTYQWEIPNPWPEYYFNITGIRMQAATTTSNVDNIRNFRWQLLDAGGIVLHTDSLTYTSFYGPNPLAHIAFGDQSAGTPIHKHGAGVSIAFWEMRLAQLGQFIGTTIKITDSSPYPDTINHIGDNNRWAFFGQMKARVCRTNDLLPTPTPIPPTHTPTPNPDVIDTLLVGFLPYPNLDDLNLTIDAIRAADLPKSKSISFDLSMYGICDDSNELACARYAYLAFFGFFMEYTGNPPSVWDLLSVTYHGELSDWQLDPMAVEALARNFLDGSTGGCRYIVSSYDCSYSNIVTWLSTLQHWLLDPPKGAVGPTHITVNLYHLLRINDEVIDHLNERRLQGLISTEEFHALMNRGGGGIFDYDGFIRTSMNGNLVWRTGQGPDVPSTWGNKELSLGSETYADFNSVEQFLPLIRHHFTKPGSPIKWSEAVYPNPDTMPPEGYALTCTLLSIITTTDGRIATSACNQ